MHLKGSEINFEVTSNCAIHICLKPPVISGPSNIDIEAGPLVFGLEKRKDNDIQ